MNAAQLDVLADESALAYKAWTDAVRDMESAQARRKTVRQPRSQIEVDKSIRSMLSSLNTNPLAPTANEMARALLIEHAMETAEYQYAEESFNKAKLLVDACEKNVRDLFARMVEVARQG